MFYTDNLHAVGVLCQFQIIFEIRQHFRVPSVRDGWQSYCIPDTMESKNGQKLAEGGFMWPSRMPRVPSFYTLRRYPAYCIF